MEKRIKVIVSFIAKHLDEVNTVDDIQKLSENKDLINKNFVRLDIFDALTKYRNAIIKESNLHPSEALIKTYSIVRNTDPIPTKPFDQQKYEKIKKSIISYSSWNNKRSQ